MKIKINIRRELKIAVSLGVLFFFIGFSERQQSATSVIDIIIQVENTLENHLLDEQDIIDLMQLNSENLKGASLEKLNLKTIERRILANKLVDNAQLYSDLKGNLIVKAILRRPIARIIRNNEPDKYIAEDGTIMPVSDKFTPRVVLISGAYVKSLLTLKSLNTSDEGRQLMVILKTIREDDFWRAQITQLDIDRKAYITMLPQIGHQTIEFGSPDGVAFKFKKLRVFYKEILPQMGWNKYHRVNVEFGDQIIAE
jgi:cell division protein FtsQ